MTMSSTAIMDPLLTHREAHQVASAIETAERKTSGEIKVVITRHCWTTLERKAAKIIRECGLDQTAERAAVLILIVAANREFIIRGDRGIHARAGQDFWDDIRDVMANAFAQGFYARGLCDGIELIADRLAADFPARETACNELSNEIVYDD